MGEKVSMNTDLCNIALVWIGFRGRSGAKRLHIQMNGPRKNAIAAPNEDHSDSTEGDNSKWLTTESTHVKLCAYE